jgi:quinone-modifying oxidoreductase subunit QmoB
MADEVEGKIGLYICSGCEIGKAVNTEKLVEAVEEEGGAEVVKVHEFLCSDDAVNMIKADISSLGLNRVVIAACSGRINSDVFNFGPEVFVERIPLREFVAWSHTGPADDGTPDEDTQMLGEDYCRMGVAKAKGAKAPVPHIEEEFCKTLLVVGGGVTGLTSAKAAAEAGYEVVLVEKEGELGGRVKTYAGVFPKKPPYRDVAPTEIEGLVDQVQSLEKIKVYTNTTVGEIAGQPGQFDVTLKNGNGGTKERIGTIVLASGWKPYPADRLTHLGYGECQNIVTNLDIEAMAKEGTFKRPSDGAAPKSVAFIQCAGSRDQDHLPYCSGVCCRVSLKQAKYIREKLPDAKVYVLYKDLRSPMQYELFYAQVQEDEGIFLTKGEVESVTENDDKSVTIKLTDTLLGEEITITADMTVLATGMTPTTLVEGADEAPAEESEEKKEGEGDGEADGASAEVGAKILNLTYRLGTDLPTLKYGFPDSHFVCFPYETRRTGIYAAGTVRAPMDISACQSDAYGATMKAVQCMELMSKGMAVHPRANDISWPDFALTRCTQCKRCTEECPFGSLDEDVKGTPMPNPNRCRRCGICMGACPERIVSFSNYSVHIIASMIKCIEIPDEEDEKPRVLVFACENDAIPALEMAALQRKQYSAMVRIIPVRCLGSMNIVWIADALSSGFDGVILLGCKHGDDYQCHFVRGSELAETRMGNVKEKLKQLALEEERVLITEVAIDDYEKIPGIIDEFIDMIETIGYNPFKGF